MRRPAIACFGLCVLAFSYWDLVSSVGQVREPWDARLYWSTAYPFALLASAAAGLLFKRYGWMAGFIIIFMQLPVMQLNAETDHRWLLAVMFLTLLAAPALVLSSAAAWAARRRSERRA